jgi:hypothetical protein
MKTQQRFEAEELEWLERRFFAPITGSRASTWPVPGQSTGEEESPDG